MKGSLTDSETIRSLLTRHGFHFSKALGQNFLIDASVPPRIGCLTAELAKRAGRVLTVEMDRRLEPVLAETLAGEENVEILFSDIMKQDIRALAGEKLPQPVKLVCANLPYQITTPVLTALAEADCFTRISVMIQKEVAERICAGPG